MSIDNRYCYFNSVVFFVYRFKRAGCSKIIIVLYVVELLINSSLYFFLSFEYLMEIVSSLKRLPQLLDLALSHFMISTVPD